MGTVTLNDGRTIGYEQFGDLEGHPVLWCHGGPGNRLEAETLGPIAAARGLRLIGIDRPGYGLSTPLPGRSIVDWVSDGVAVADELGIGRCAAVGVSTGGAYALAWASAHPDRVTAVVAACALTDMSWPEGRTMMTEKAGIGPAMDGIWSAPDRATAMKAAESIFGTDGSGIVAMGAQGPPLPAADIAFMTDPETMPALIRGMRESFTFGLEGYVDDRLADGVGWTTFDVTAVRCPVAVIHGSEDTLVPVALAHHTASLVSGATLRVFPELGHFSIVREVVPTMAGLVGS